MGIALPSMLSFERKLETSDALMHSGKWSDIGAKENWLPIGITKRENRSTQSSEGTSDANKVKPNPVSSGSDDANLPMEHDTLRVGFSMRVIGNLGVPFGCNSPAFSDAIQTKTAAFKNSDGLDLLAYRYAYNIANGRFLWRNRVGAKEVQINVKVNDDVLIFNAYDFSLKNFEKSSDNPDLQKLTNVIKEGLAGDHQSFVLLEVDAYVQLGYKQHVFPSQKMNMEEKGKSLFTLQGCAAMHNVKIGNAIRTIDTWYNRYGEQGFPIAIEPFGSVTQIGEAFRKNKKEGDLYTLIIEWVNNADLNLEQQAYVVGNLIRGGVFGKSKEK